MKGRRKDKKKKKKRNEIRKRGKCNITSKSKIRITHYVISKEQRFYRPLKC